MQSPGQTRVSRINNQIKRLNLNCQLNMTHHILLFGLLLLSNLLSGQSTVFIQDAADKKIIEYRITGSWSSSDESEYIDADGMHYGKCMTMDLKSKVDSTIWIDIRNGLMLMCEDTLTQDMIITQPVYVELQPGKSKTIQLYAMCAEIHDGVPHRQTAYRIGTMADSNLVAITHAIDAMFMQNIVGQSAVWAYTDNATEQDIRKYGATNASIELTIQVLNSAGVSTLLNPPATVDSAPAVPPADTRLPETFPDSTFVPIESWVLYSACGIILLLLGTVVFLLIKKRSTRTGEDNVT